MNWNLDNMLKEIFQRQFLFLLSSISMLLPNHYQSLNIDISKKKFIYKKLHAAEQIKFTASSQI